MGPLRSVVLTVSLVAMLALGAAVSAQVPTLAEQKQRLAAADAESRAAQQRSDRLERQAAGERDAAAQARSREAAAAERIRAAQADIAAAQARLAIVDRELAAQRVRLGERQGSVVRLIAALQSMARRPAVLALVQPGSTEDMVHVRAVLGTVMPVVERRTADARADLARARTLRGEAVAAIAGLREGRVRVEKERIALVRLEADHRLRAGQLGRTALVESDRAIALGEQARDLVDQIETGTDAQALEQELAVLPGPLPRPARVGEGAAPSVLAGAAPYRLPIAGRIETGFGELAPTGVRARGLTLLPAANARAVAPAGGRVAYAQGFRGYGGIVIIDHGQGWTSLVTGLAQIAVKPGQVIAAGAPIGRVGADSPRLTVELRRRGRPMDIARMLD
ncbi:peptidoglycan DD-metalloendopeptidase family protein [Sphingomonas sp. HF-S3]|uniref:Peptidoglycan DD-metalloendopeptidase family protein n=1 Tax=Sphingomonas rustica TaxID=3103142 RepID=A0ABV0BC84_9SPHN